jgi:regulatory subunit for Cdc7p protein kinase
MAAVSLSPLPITLTTMSSRRAPLLNNPNAINSPYRPSAAAPSKQKRSYANIQREDAYGQPPPAKKQMVESRQVLRTPPRHQSTHVQGEGRVFTRKSTTQQSAFERKCVVAAREKSAQQTAVKADKTTEENLEVIRQWQKFYRKAFPTFVFYFESVPEETRLKYAKQVAALGAVSQSVHCRTHRYTYTNASCREKRNFSQTLLLMLSPLEVFQLSMLARWKKRRRQQTKPTPKTANLKQSILLY